MCKTRKKSIAKTWQEAYEVSCQRPARTRCLSTRIPHVPLRFSGNLYIPEASRGQVVGPGDGIESHFRVVWVRGWASGGKKRQSNSIELFGRYVRRLRRVYVDFEYIWISSLESFFQINKNKANIFIIANVYMSKINSTNDFLTWQSSIFHG